jgi:hypothetical protein
MQRRMPQIIALVGNFCQGESVTGNGECLLLCSCPPNLVAENRRQLDAFGAAGRARAGVLAKLDARSPPWAVRDLLLSAACGERRRSVGQVSGKRC